MSNIINLKSVSNPWAGLSSYQDPATVQGEPLKFCGRDNESYDVAQLIDDNIFVTLYGKSGTGKTSLLNAGVFPRLRQEQYLPISIRLGIEEKLSFVTIIATAIRMAIAEQGGTIELIRVVDEQQDQLAPDCLWHYFARRRFISAEGKVLFPVIVFDQFEEVFRYRRQDTEALLRQIHFMMDENHAISDRMVDGVPYSYDFNFRFVAAIREDDLYRLEDSIDNCYLPELKRCRYRLRSLSEQGARDAILIPGEGLFKADEQEQIVHTISNIARNKADGSVSTNLLSLVCNRIFVEGQRSGADQITASLVDSFVKGNPFERFYNEATQGFSNRERSYIENMLVDSTGRRNSIPESDFLMHVPCGAVLLEGSRKILQRISTSSDGNSNRIELIHDSFCEPLAGLKEKRKRKKRLIRIVAVAHIVPLLIAIPLLFYYLIHRVQTQGETISLQDEQLIHERDSVQQINERLNLTLLNLQEANKQKDSTNALLKESFQQLSEREQEISSKNHEAQTNMSRVLAEKASKLVDEGDSYLARLIALEALPPNRPYTIEAEAALRKACGHDDAILRGHTRMVLSTAFCPDGKRIVSASYDGTIRIWDTQTGVLIGKPLKDTSFANCVSFSPNGKYIVSGLQDWSISLWDARKGEKLPLPFKGHTGTVCTVSFSHDGKYIVSSSADSTVRIWDVSNGEQIGKSLKHSNIVVSAVYNRQGNRIVTACLDRKIRIWDANSMMQVGDAIPTGSYIRFASFSPDSIGRYIMAVSEEKTISIWDSGTTEKIFKLRKKNSGIIRSASFSPDGKHIISASDDDMVYIWNVKKQEIVDSVKGAISAAYSSNGGHIVTGSKDGIIRIFNTTKELSLQKQRLLSLKYDNSFLSPDGKIIALVQVDGDIIELMDLETKKIIGEKIIASETSSVSFSPDGELLAIVSLDKTIRILNIKNGTQMSELKGHIPRVRSTSFSMDGKCLISASYDNTISFWDPITGEEIRKPIEIAARGARYASFSPNANFVVSAHGDNSIRIWDIQNKKQVGKPIMGHTDYINSVNFSPDGKYIVSASSDKTIRIWDAKTGLQVIEPLTGHTDAVRSAVFSHDGKHIVSASDDNTIRIWDFPSLQELIDQTRERFKDRPLTPEERRQYYLE